MLSAMYAERHKLAFVLTDAMLNVIMLSVVALSCRPTITFAGTLVVGVCLAITLVTQTAQLKVVHNSF